MYDGRLTKDVLEVMAKAGLECTNTDYMLTKHALKATATN